MTPDDAAILRLYAGSHFLPGSTLILPSGICLEAAEANVLTSFYLPEDGLPDRTVPAHLARMLCTVELRDLMDIHRERDELRAALRGAQDYGKQMWIVACFFAATALLAVSLLVWALFSGAA